MSGGDRRRRTDRGNRGGRNERAADRSARKAERHAGACTTWTVREWATRARRTDELVKGQGGLGASGC